MYAQDGEHVRAHQAGTQWAMQKDMVDVDGDGFGCIRQWDEQVDVVVKYVERWRVVDVYDTKWVEAVDILMMKAGANGESPYARAITSAN